MKIQMSNRFGKCGVMKYCFWSASACWCKEQPSSK